jgi:hypothetical protein
MSDLPVLSFIRVIIGYNMSKKLEEYRNHKVLNERMHNNVVSMGFGLHVGWAIEVN